jgi:protocatechuate 3,4-dioxygenase alpha subunit
MAVKYLKETPSQTAGPYVHIGTVPAAAGLEVRTQERLHVTGLKGERIVIEGVVRDGAGELVRDAMLEIWQADASGEFEGGHAGWARAATDFRSGLYRFETVKPGSVPWRDGRPQAPHITLYVFARGINIHLHTRLYFDDEEEANATDPVLRQVSGEAQRRNLIARRDARATPLTYRFDIVLQGEDETVFFDM